MSAASAGEVHDHAQAQRVDAVGLGAAGGGDDRVLLGGGGARREADDERLGSAGAGLADGEGATDGDGATDGSTDGAGEALGSGVALGAGVGSAVGVGIGASDGVGVGWVGSVGAGVGWSGVGAGIGVASGVRSGAGVTSGVGSGFSIGSTGAGVGSGVGSTHFQWLGRRVRLGLGRRVGRLLLLDRPGGRVGLRVRLGRRLRRRRGRGVRLLRLLHDHRDRLRHRRRVGRGRLRDGGAQHRGQHGDRLDEHDRDAGRAVQSMFGSCGVGLRTHRWFMPFRRRGTLITRARGPDAAAHGERSRMPPGGPAGGFALAKHLGGAAPGGFMWGPAQHHERHERHEHEQRQHDPEQDLLEVHDREMPKLPG